MAFDPDAYLAKKAALKSAPVSNGVKKPFDPDAYLAKKLALKSGPQEAYPGEQSFKEKSWVDESGKLKPEYVEEPESTGEWLQQTGKGLLSGVALPGTSYAAGAARVPADIIKSALEGDVEFSPVESFKKGKRSFEKRTGQWTEEAPIASALGSIVPTIALSGTGAGILSKVGPLKAAAKTSPGLLPKLLEGAKGLGRGLIGDVGAMKLMGSSNEEILEAAPYLAGGGVLSNVATPIAGAALGAGKQVAKKRGAALLEKVLKRPANVLKSEAAKGATLGEELYEKGIFGGLKGLQRKGEEGLEKFENILQEQLKSKGAIKNQTVIEELNNLKGNLSSLPESETSIKKIDQLTKKLSEGEGISASEANKVKRQIYKKYESAYLKEARPEKSERLTTYARGLRKAIEEQAPEVVGINKQLSMYGRLKEASESALAKQTKGGLGLLDILTAAGGGSAVGLKTGDASTGSLAGLALLGARTPIGRALRAKGYKGGSKLLDVMQAINKQQPLRYVAPAYFNAKNKND